MIVFLCIYRGEWDDEYAVCASHERAKDWIFEVMDRKEKHAIRDVDKVALERAKKKRDVDQAIHLWSRFTDDGESFMLIPTDLLDHSVEEKLECKPTS